MVPLMLKRLHQLQAQAAEERLAALNSSRPFAHLGSKSESKVEHGSSPITKKKKIESCMIILCFVYVFFISRGMLGL